MYAIRSYYVLIIYTAILTAAGCASLPTGIERPISHPFSDTQDSILGKYVSAKADHFPGKSGFHLLANGLDAFTARAVLAET